MRFISTLAAAAAAIMLSFAPIQAAEKVTVPANKTSGITFIYLGASLEYNCLSSGKGKIKISREPEHGVVRTEWRKVKGDFKNGCKGKTMNGLAIYYRPHKGYRGDDRFKIQASFPGLYGGAMNDVSRSWSFDLTVK